MTKDSKESLYFHDCKLTIFGKYHQGFYHNDNDCYNLFIVLDGNAAFCCERKTINLTKGDSIIFPMQCLFSIQDISHCGALQVSFRLEKSDCTDVCLYDYLSNILNESIVTSNTKYNSSIGKSSDLLDCMELMKYIISTAKNRNSSHISSEQTSQMVLNFLKLNYSAHVTSEMLEKEFNIRYSKLHAAFKKDIGVSIHSKLKEIRIDAAKKLLIDTNMPISEVAFRIGYENEYYFSASFKKATSLSPTKYRKLKSEGGIETNEQ